MSGELLVEAPDTVAVEHGLLTGGAWQVVNDREARWEANGITFQPWPCTGPRGLDPTCNVDPAHDDLTVPPGVHAAVVVKPATYYATDVCSMPSVLAGGLDVTARARHSVVLGLQAALENELWRGTVAGAQAVTLTNAPTVLSATPLALPVALGMLEAALGAGAGGVGTLHLPTAVGTSLLHGGGLIRTDGQRLRTISKGHVVVIGDGYPGTGPSNVAPAAGTVWIYGTGTVTVRLAGVNEANPVNRPAGRTGPNDLRMNEALGLVSQSALVYHDTCRKYAVLVSL